jgi:type I restriction enzyme R subunit
MSGRETVADAKKQYQESRNPKELLFTFKQRALVHFAVDTTRVFMTTRLNGKKTHFLPFNRGYQHGADNPPVENDYATAYLWREVLARDSLLSILGKFMHLQVEEKRLYSPEGIKRFQTETLIFPRYHQLDVVRKLVAHTRTVGAGRNYLIQHSAGSGKSNSIAWLAHQLASLHNAADEKVFDTTIVITDRRVLDQQLQKTIYQFEHKEGVIQRIDEDTRQLVDALTSNTPIIISTLQKFPFVVETLDKLNKEKAEKAAQANDERGSYNALTWNTKGKRFAVIVDEAHSSQTGENAMDLKGILNQEGIQEAAQQYLEDHYDEYGDVEGDIDPLESAVRTMMKRGKQENISFFGFTATPKYKTKYIFDEPGASGKAPFHEYTMKQAIEETFILDVLANYTTYDTFYALKLKSEHDPEVIRTPTTKALLRFASLHPTVIQQKTEIMVEHFRQHVRAKIGGRAKAMVVTESRLHAVRYKRAFDTYINDKGYSDVRTLVAFSGTVQDKDIPDSSFTEVQMNNGIKEKELPEQFDSNEYQVLLVAEKYQTGFDQPYLHTMYVDKRLAGIQAVQTLSRLNRTCAGKTDTFVLDFRNKADDIYKAFKPFYEVTQAEALVDAQKLYDLQHRVMEYHLFTVDDTLTFYRCFDPLKDKINKKDHANMNSLLDKAVVCFCALDETQQDEAKSQLVNFRNIYAFLSQVIPFQDQELELLYVYIRFLLTKLPRRPNADTQRIDDLVDLDYYRAEKQEALRIQLDDGEEADALKAPTDVGTGGARDEVVALSRLIDVLNARFGGDFTQADELFFNQIQQQAVEDETLQQAAKVNSFEDFKSLLKDSLNGLIIDRMDDNEALFARMMTDEDFNATAFEWMAAQIYQQLDKPEGDEDDPTGAT